MKLNVSYKNKNNIIKDQTKEIKYNNKSYYRNKVKGQCIYIYIVKLRNGNF